MAHRRRPKTVGVVACSSGKLDPASVGRKTLPAAVLYRKSALFRKASALAEATTDEWVILSAKHGLVMPWEQLRPYNKTLPASGDARWAARVRKALLERFDPDQTEFVVLAGARYRKHLFDEEEGAFHFEVPMEGMQIGEQLAWLTRGLQELGVE